MVSVVCVWFFYGGVNMVIYVVCLLFSPCSVVPHLWSYVPCLYVILIKFIDLLAILINWAYVRAVWMALKLSNQ